METITKIIVFKTPKEMVNWLMDNEGLELGDGYGRRWKYEDWEFHFKDINGEYTNKVDCLHLYGTSMGVIKWRP